MDTSLYAASVPVFRRGLQNATAILGKAQAHAAAKHIDPEVLLLARLFPDMYPMIRQVQICAIFARDVPARIAGREGEKIAFPEKTFADLHERLGNTQQDQASFEPSHIEGNETREILVGAGTPQEKKMSGQSYLLDYGLPNFFFHLSVMYTILRHCGVELGKADFLGAG